MDIVPPAQLSAQPFNGTRMFSAFDPALFRLIQLNLGRRSLTAPPPRADFDPVLCDKWAALESAPCDTDPPRMLNDCQTTCALQVQAACCDLAMTMVINALKKTGSGDLGPDGDDFKPQTWHEDSMPDPISIRGLNELSFVCQMLSMRLVFTHLL